MSRLWSSGFELQSTATGVEFDGQAGGTSVSINTTTKRSGNASMRCNPTADTSFFRHQVITAANTGILYARIYIYIVTNPASGGLTVMSLGNSSAGTIGDIILDNDNSFYLQGNGGKVGVNSAKVYNQTWNCLEISANDGDSNNVIVARLNGVQFASGTGKAIATGTAYLWLGFIDAQTGDIYFDDVAVNDSSGSFQTSWPGFGSIVHLKPSATGDNNDFAVQVGGTAGAANNFTRVQEATPDDATTYNADTVTNHIDDFNIDDTPSTILPSDTINVVQVGIRYSALIAALESSLKVRFKSSSGGTVSKSSAITPTSVSWTTDANAAPFVSPLTLYQTPDSTTLTKANLDTALIGYEVSTGNTNGSAVSDIWLMVESTSPLPSNRPENELRYISVGNGMSRSEGTT